MLQLGSGLQCCSAALGGFMFLVACDKVGDLGDDTDSKASTDDGSSETSTGDDGTTVCGPDDCGPAPGAPNYLCPDGMTLAGPGACVPQDDGSCGWDWIECPPDATDDGETAPGSDDGATGTTGVDDCDCPVGAYLPACGVDGMTYDATCGNHCVPVEIECMSECPCTDAETGGSSSSGGV